MTQPTPIHDPFYDEAYDVGFRYGLMAGWAQAAVCIVRWVAAGLLYRWVIS